MPATYARLSLDVVSTVDRAAEELRRALFEGELPPGTPLREVAIAEALGVSRSTVREALGMLVAEGLADRLPNRGTQVRRLDPGQVSDVCHSRLVLESAGMRAWPSASEEGRDEVRQALRTYSDLRTSDCSTAEFTAAHLDFHRSITALTGSSRMVAFADALYAEVRLALAQVDRARGNAAEQVHSHQLLLDLLESGDVDAAVSELVEHLREAEESMIEVVSLGWEA